MTYIINRSNKLEFHTNLKDLLFPIIEFVANYNWLLTNQDYIIYDFEEKGSVSKLNFDSKKIEYTGKEFLELIKTRNIQFIWGVFCAFKNEIPNIPMEELPYADCNENVWNKPDEFLIASSEIEIICFDGTSTLIKFRDKKIGQQFIEYFNEAKIL